MPPANPEKKKKKRVKKKKQAKDDDFNEAAGIVQKLKQRYQNKKEDSEVIKDPIIKNGKLLHPTRYLSIIERGQKAQQSRLQVPDPPENLIQTKWICALCQRYSCSDNLGDLFGPYYIEIDTTKPIPTFLFADGITASNTVKQSIEIYLHGRCALWSENLYFFGGKFPKLDERLYQYWEILCELCKERGASINYKENCYAHFYCLDCLGYKFDNSNLSISGTSKTAENVIV
uniref:Uncharacterized protein n=1 Tax=Panagrolaimus sp. PS1159 TaxID=55785 RepID=A0AC35GN05_9BILA